MKVESWISSISSLQFSAASRDSNQQPSTPRTSWCPKTFLEPELQPIQHNIEILRLLARYTGILQPIHVKVGLVLHPIVEIPVHTKREFISVAIKRSDKPWSDRVGYKNARFLRLDSVVSERQLPGSPSVSSSCSLQTHERALHFRSAVFWPGFTGQQISGLHVTGFCHNPGKSHETQSVGRLRAHRAPELVKLIVFRPHRPRAVGPGDFAVIALDRAVDPERGEKGVSGVGYGGAKALLPGKAPAAAPSDRSAKRESLQQIVFLLPGIEAQPANDFRLVGGVVGQYSLAVKCPHPILHDAAVEVTANHRPRAAERGSCGRVQERRQRPFHKIQVGCAGQSFLGERFLELADLEYESRVGFHVDVEITQGDAVGSGGVDQHRVVVVRAEIALKTETGSPNEGRVRGRAVAFVGAVVGLAIAVRLNLKFAVGALDKEVLPAPSRDHRGFWLRLGRLLVFGRGPRLLGRLPQARHHQMDDSDRLRVGCPRGGSVASGLVGQFLDQSFQFLDSLAPRGEFTTPLVGFLLGCARGGRWFGSVGRFLRLSQRTRDKHQCEYEKRSERAHALPPRVDL